MIRRGVCLVRPIPVLLNKFSRLTARQQLLRRATAKVRVRSQRIRPLQVR